MAQMRLINLFPSWITNGLFAQLGDWTPWNDAEDIDKSALDIAYFGNRSGDAPISPLLKKMINTKEGPILSDVEIARIDGVLRAMYGLSWKKVWDALRLDYNPIENYNSTENRTLTGNDTEGGSVTKTDAKTSSTTSNIDEETIVGESTTGTTNNGTEAVFPINATSAVKTTQTEGKDDTTASKRIDTHDGYSDVQTTESTNGSETHNRNFDRSETYTLTRKGNIGVTTSQQMLTAEIEVRRNHFFEIVFNDLDEVLTGSCVRIDTKEDRLNVLL